MSHTDQPLHRPRPTGWTHAKQVAFLNRLKATGSVSHAADSVGMSRQSAYKLRRKLAGQPFAQAWDLAVDDWRLTGALALAGACPTCGCIPRSGAGFRK